MKPIYTLLFCFFISIASTMAFDQSVASLTFLKDLPNKDVLHFIQDSDGYLWIATQNGLYRYDGYKYQTFRSDLNNPDMISGNEVRRVAEDSEKRIWFATMAGLDRYDKKTGTIEHITETNGMSTTSIWAILPSKDNNTIWIGNDEGLWEYSSVDDTYTYRSSEISKIKRNVGLKCLLEDHNGDVWIGTWDIGLFRYIKSNGEIIQYPQINERNSVYSLAEDEKNRIWVGSWQCGIQVIENAWDIEGMNVTTVNKNDNGLRHDIIYTLYADHTNQAVYVGTPQGLTIIDTKTLSPNNLITVSGTVYPGEQLISFQKGFNGLLWAGMTGKGLCAINPSGNLYGIDKQEDVSRLLGTNSCRSLLINQDGQLFEGLATTGFIIKDTTSGDFVSWKEIPEFATETTLSTIESMIESRRDGHIWMASLAMCVIEFDPKASIGSRVKRYTAEDCQWLNSNTIYTILEDHNSNLWFAGNGNFSMKGVDGTIIKLDTLHIADRRTLLNTTVYNMDEDGDGNLWLATQRDGIIKISNNGDNWTADNYNTSNGKLLTNNFNCIHADSKGRVWAGSASCGLYLYDSDNDSFVSLQQKWQIPGDAVNSIIEETASSLWLGTNAGIVSLTLNSNADIAKIRLFQIEDGLQDNIFNRNAATRASDGKIFMGGNLGLNYFYPKDIVERNEELNVNLTDFRVNNVSWMTINQKDKRKVSKLGPEYTENITLDYNQNTLTLDFSTFDFVNQDRVKYMYMMQGVDTKPTITEGIRHVAHYSNLSPGNYTFLLSSPNGLFTRKIKIHVNPPFWLSWWAYIIYIILFIIGLNLFYRWMKQRMNRIQNLRMRVFERARKEKQREAEVEANAIAKTRDEMQQKFKQELQTAADKKKLVFEAKEVEISSNDEEFLRKALECVNNNIANANYDQQQFLDDMGISKSTCFRKLKALTGMGFSQFIRDIRMNAACRILEEKKGIRVSELAYAVGYSDPRYFSTCFKKEYGMMPSEYAEKFNPAEKVQ